MVIALHVTVALLSIVISGLACLYPSSAKLRVSYGLVVATLVSGTYLVLGAKAHILQTCLMGLLYLGTTFTLITVARYKLAKENQTL